MDSVINKLGRVQECIRQSLPGVHWDFLYLHIHSCSRSVFTDSIDFQYLHNHKIFLKPKRTSSSSEVTASDSPDRWRSYHPCVFLTLGIGGETTLEQEMSGLYPECEFHGADPNPSVSQDYRRYGTYYAVGIDDATNTNQTLDVLIGGKYQLTQSATKEIGRFLEEDVQRPVIHFASIDIEGSEYRIMPYLIRQRDHNLKKHNPEDSYSSLADWLMHLKTPVICQMLLELHGTNLNFADLVSEFFTKSGFVPLIAFPPGNTHYKVFAVNAAEVECIKLFDWEPETKPFNEKLVAEGQSNFTKLPDIKFKQKYPKLD